MFADPFVVTFDAPLGAKSLPRINQDNYGTEYFLQNTDGLSEFRLKIRHSKESVKNGANAVDRHQFLLEQYVYPTTAVPLGRTRQAYIILRNEPGDDLAACNDLMEALMLLASEANITKLLAWES